MSLGGNTVMKRHEVAKPLHIQRLEAALDVRPFVSQVEKILQSDAGSESDDDEDIKSMNLRNEMSKGDKILHGVVTTKHERQNDRQRLFNLSSVSEERAWLRGVVLSSGTETDSEDDTPTGKDLRIKRLLKERAFHNKYLKEYYKDPGKSRYMYYGAGLLSTIDRYPERRGLPTRGRGRGKGRRGRERAKGERKENNQNDTVDWEEQLRNLKQENEHEEPVTTEKPGVRGRKKLSTLKTAEALTARRRRHWQLLVKKELGKVQRARTATHRELMLQRKRLATLCCKSWRHAAMQSQKNMKETVWRCKRLSREMQTYWRRYDRAERETRRRMEKEAEEQRKMDVELMEAKRQRRKLNFLITQTELYAHFMQKKLDNTEGDDSGTDDILMHLDEDKDPRLVAVDRYDSESMKELAARNALEAVRAEQARTKQFDAAAGAESTAERHNGDYDQPSIFRGTLKGYQLKGMNWLANLYYQGISGILADEMGLGKTVQCLAFLCHVAERLGVWGPFLVVSPASTLHNWQQELEKFVPDFKVVPYWGSPAERKILRQFWERKDLHTQRAAFHVVVTSYQIVISDLKYLNRVSWQYMILDEAQAIKSSASMRWKLLLGFSCRNRLLLSGTPIQNSMAELWALLHFIMPTLFDSHEEFNEWFSKDIESHAENKSTIDEKHLSRLHMILKPFMLRRIKKDVENELSDKIEIMVHCPLTLRQKLLYMALKKKIKIEELLNLTISGDSGHGLDKSFTSNLMNLVMQFRKVCNHPELFERRDVKSPFALRCDDYHMPKILAEDCILVRQIPSKRHILYNKLSVLTPEYVHRNSVDPGCFSFVRFMDLSPMELYGVMLCGWLYAIKHIQTTVANYEQLRHRQHWWYNTMSNIELKQESEKETYDTYDTTQDRVRSKHRLLICQDGDVLKQRKEDSFLWSELLFTDPVWVFGGPFFTRTDHIIHFMPETIEHRAIRHKNVMSDGNYDYNQGEILTEIKTEEGGVISVNTSIFPHSERPSYLRREQPTPMLEYLRCYSPKASAPPLSPFSSSRSYAYHLTRHFHCENKEGASLVDELVNHTRPAKGWTSIQVPDKNQLVSDAGKLTVLDSLLRRLKERGHRVLIYSQMTKMIDLLEEYMWHRRHKYMRLDGSSKISARRDMVADFQNRADIFVFLLSTRAGGLGINLTAADTVIFYDSDWNPTVDQQAMDRAHRLGQTKQVTVYRLICKGTIEERIMQRAREKSEIQRMVISGGNFKPDTLKPKEVVSLLLDDEEIELKYRQKSEEKKAEERKRKSGVLPPPSIIENKRTRDSTSEPGSPLNVDDDCDNLVVDASPVPSPTSFSPVGSGAQSRWRGRRGRGAARRGRPPTHRGARHSHSHSHSHGQSASQGDTLVLGPGHEGGRAEEQGCPTAQESRGRPRGPGRPRLAPRGPPRPLRRPRRPLEPLLVPLAPPPTN